MRFILASNNAGKLKEMKALLGGLDIEIVSQREAGLILDVEENGSTFEENAFIKANAACKLSKLPAIADDSGLCVDALGGEPGIYSARFGGEGLDDVGRYNLLLKMLEQTEKRKAKFVCSIACVMPNGDVIRAYGECLGEILREPQGNGGFGYDPIFYVPEMGMSMAELGSDVKNFISHRAKAMADFRQKLTNYFSER